MSARRALTVEPTGRVYRWVTFGIPELLASDNGRDFVSRFLREAAAKNAMSMHFTPVKTPRAKGTVERSFGTVNTRLLHRLPGTTLGKSLAHLNYEASKHAALTLPQLRELMEQYVVTVHNPAQRRGRWRSANDLFLEGIQRHPPRMPMAESDLDGLFGLTEFRVVQQYGIQYRYLKYQSDELVDVFHTSKPGTTLSFSVDITDLRAVRVQHPVTGRHFVARCILNLGDDPYARAVWDFVQAPVAPAPALPTLNALCSRRRSSAHSAQQRSSNEALSSSSVLKHWLTSRAYVASVEAPPAGGRGPPWQASSRHDGTRTQVHRAGAEPGLAARGPAGPWRPGPAAARALLRHR